MEETIAERKDVSKEKIIAVKAEVYSRVVGYYRPVANWNDGKREEFNERNYLSFKSEEVAE
jgi:anaerobic ribonucleoside-triphosphate reductase